MESNKGTRQDNVPATRGGAHGHAARGAVSKESAALTYIARTFGAQFARPRGPLGQLVARIMRRGNAPLNLWVVDLLAITPHHRVLEVGFGPGVALAALATRASHGMVAGIDFSASMVRQARSRHAAAITAGRLDLRQGDAAALPFAEGSFDVVCATHVLYFWPDPVATMRELRRVLRPGGTLALGYQERAHMPPRAARGLSLAGARLVGPEDVARMARAAGFTRVRVETRATLEGPAGFCALAVKEPEA